MLTDASPCCATGCSLAIHSWPAAPTCPPRCAWLVPLSTCTLALGCKATNLRQKARRAPHPHTLPRIVRCGQSLLRCLPSGVTPPPSCACPFCAGALGPPVCSDRDEAGWGGHRIPHRPQQVGSILAWRGLACQQHTISTAWRQHVRHPPEPVLMILQAHRMLPCKFCDMVPQHGRPVCTVALHSTWDEMVWQRACCAAGSTTWCPRMGCPCCRPPRSRSWW